MENNRDSWGSNLGFILAAVGSAVGLGNIWGFPFKMGKSGGFTFLIIYLILAAIVGVTIMTSELALGRMTGMSPVMAYRKVTKRFKFLGWMAVIAPSLIMTFYSVLGGYCIYYIFVNVKGLFGEMQGSETFETMLLNMPISIGVTVAFMIICCIVVAGGVSKGIEKFNKVGMPALFVMLVIVIVKAWTMPHAMDGLKFMFVPGYAVKAGYIESAPSVLEVLATAGGQMFFSLSLAMGIMITYGSYVEKEENIVKNSGVIVVADTCAALMAGLAVIPAAVSNGLQNGLARNEISLGGPSLLFATLQDTFKSMGSIGGLFGLIFYVLVLIAAVSSAISLLEVISSHYIDRAKDCGMDIDRKKIVLRISAVVTVVASFVAADGLGSNGFSPAALLGIEPSGWSDCWLDFMDVWSEGILMPAGAMIMSLMIGGEVKPKVFLDEIHCGSKPGFFDKIYGPSITFIVPIVMCFILAGQMISFFANPKICYTIAVALLVIFAIRAYQKSRKDL